MSAYSFIALTILLTVYGQMVLKWQVGVDPSLSPANNSPAGLALAIFLNPWVLSAFAAAFAASLCWIGALDKLPLSKAYPFTVLSLPAVALLSWIVFGETITFGKVAGTALVCIGIIIVARS